MRLAKKITGMLVMMCLLITLVPTAVYAASGRVSFTDLTTEAGEEFVIKISVTSETESLGSFNIVMDYDNQAIEFISGANVTAENGVLTYASEGDGTSAYTEVTFMALKYGETQITISDLTVTSSAGEEIEMTEGYSAVVVEGGTEVEASESATTTTTGGSDTVTVDGVDYTVSTDDLSSLTPEGYSQTTFEYNASTYYAVVGDTSGIMLAGLVDATGETTLFYYDEDVATFYPYVQITVSDSTYIVFLQDELTIELPSQYVETILTVNEFEYPTWEDTSNTGYYLINAINSNGEVCVYQYDNADQTYQRFITPEIEVEEEVTFADTFADAVGESLQMLLIATFLVFLLLIVVVIVFGIKLNNRNNELDKLYDKVDAGKITEKKAKKVEPVVAKKKVKKVEKIVKDEFVDEFDDDFDDDFGHDEFADEFDDDDDYEDDFDDDFDDDEFDDEFDDDFADEFDDYEDDDFEEDENGFDDDFEVTLPKQVSQSLEEQPVSQRRSIKSAAAKRKSSNDLDDIDFIDL